MTELDYYDRWQPIAIRVHRAASLAALARVAARLLWRAWDTRPHPHPGLADRERRLSTGVHWFLLAVLVLLAVTGYLFSTSKGGTVPLVAGVLRRVAHHVARGLGISGERNPVDVGVRRQRDRAVLCVAGDH